MALISRIGFTLFDRWGANLGRLPYTAATHTEALDGTDELKITCDRELSKGQRIVWVDRQGTAHEHIVDEVSQAHDDNGTHCEATCINSIAELLDDYIEDKRPSGGVAVALASVLGDTRWEVGTCDLAGTASHTFYHISVREALSDLVSAWGGELETTIEVDGAGVTKRAIGVRSVRGNQDSPKRFTWTKDIVDIKRVTGTANPKTRVYGYGKGVETDGGGYGRRLTFGDINDGKDYVEDDAATAVWGHPDGNGGVLPAVDTYINEQCEDAEQLLAETLAYLETAKEPTVSYEANVLDLYAYGRAWEGVALGDCVAIIDKQFAENGIRLKGRVSQIERDLITADATVTFGNLVDAFTDLWQTVATALKSGSASRASYDAVANPSVGWLTLLQSALNKQFNAVGTYKVESFELGQIFSNVALNPETGLPAKTTSGMWAVNINGMGIRLASSLNAQGEWDWTTFITGSGVNADCINAGTLRADLVRTGLLTDAKKKNYWDFDNGEFSLSADSSTVDGKAIATTDEAIADVDIEYAQNSSATVAPTDGWQTTAPAWASGKYIWQRTKATAQDGTIAYSAAAMISGRDGEDGKSPTATVVKSGSVSTITITNPDGTVTTATVNDGTDGTQGANGYVHVKYSDDGGKTFTGNTGEDPGKYIGVYTDNTKADSTSVSSYTWSLIKGADGEDGTGINSISEQYYLSTSSTAQAGGSWLDTCPTYVSGLFYWTRSKITWSDGVVAYTTPVLANGTNSANSTAQAAKDAVTSLDESLDQQEVFNRLTNNGSDQGIYLKDGKVYINGTMIQSGTINADNVAVKNLRTVGTDGNKITLEDNTISISAGDIDDAITIESSVSTMVTQMFEDSGNTLPHTVENDSFVYTLTLDQYDFYFDKNGCLTWKLRFYAWYKSGYLYRQYSGTTEPTLVETVDGKSLYSIKLAYETDFPFMAYLYFYVPAGSTDPSSAYLKMLGGATGAGYVFIYSAVFTANICDPGGSIKTKSGAEFITSENFDYVLADGELWTGTISFREIYNNVNRLHTFYFANGLLQKYQQESGSS